jgi:hypothetical protein
MTNLLWVANAAGSRSHPDRFQATAVHDDSLGIRKDRAKPDQKTQVAWLQRIDGFHTFFVTTSNSHLM